GQHVEAGEDRVETGGACLFRQRFAQTTRHAQVRRLVAGAVDDHQVAPVGDELIEQFAELQTADGRVFEQLQRRLRILRQYGVGQGDDAIIAGGAEQRVNLLDGQTLTAERQQLVEQRLRVAHRTAGATGEQL